jgi:hypothetical protein
LRTDLDQNFIEYYNGTFWQTAAEETFASGTRMLFVQNFIPTGWTIDLTLNDRAIIVTSNLNNGAFPQSPAGGDTGGSWVLSGLQGQDWTLTADEIPVHSHVQNIRVGTDDGTGFTAAFGVDDGSLTSVNPPSTFAVGQNYGDDNLAPTLGEGHAHTVLQDGSWRPFNVAVIVCEKD